MKNILFLFIAFLISGSSFAQTHSCCAPPVSQKFIAMASEEAFIKSHAAPLPFHYESKSGSMIKFKTPDGKTANAYEVKNADPTHNIILMFHEWWGLNDYIKQEAEKLQAEMGNATVIAVDMYDGKVTSDPKMASQLVQGLSDARAQAIIKGAVNYCGANANIATIGWCFGGGMSLQASIAAGKQGKACVMYYGMPEKDMKKLANLSAPILGIFGTQDKFITPQLVSGFEKDMAKAGKKLAVKNYNEEHAFANPSNPKYDAVATADAWKNAVGFLRQYIR